MAWVGRLAGTASLALGLVACSSSHSSSLTASFANGGSTTPATSGAGGSIDPCLVGHWVEIGENDTLNVQGNTIMSSGGAGTTLDFTTTGKETVNYSSGASISGSNNGSEVLFTERGTVTYEVTTANNQLTFVSADFSKYSMHETFAGQQMSLPAPQLPPPDFYQCSSQQLSENGNGYRAEYQRG